MRQCKKCKEIKYWFQFYAESNALYTVSFDVCKKCAEELKNEAVSNYLKEFSKIVLIKYENRPTRHRNLNKSFKRKLTTKRNSKLYQRIYITYKA